MPAAPATVPHALGQVALTVKDVDRAVAFYRDAVGLPFLFQFPGLGFFSMGATRLMLSLPETPEFDKPGSVLYLSVGDIDGAFARMQGAGVAFRDQPHVVHRAGGSELWMTFFVDPDGNLLALMQEKPAAA
ncbi:MAG: VOC family protein [Gemmatimonadetes bacterium]|nr:VOC family protein [Gemmatimonadota bacterium]